MKKSLLLALIAVFAFGCKNSKDKYEAFAEDFCKCLEPMAELQKKYKEMMESGDPSGMDTFIQEATKADEEGQVCMADLEKKHGRITGEQEETLAMEALRKVCPDIVALMEQPVNPLMPDPEFEAPTEDAGTPEGGGGN